MIPYNFNGIGLAFFPPSQVLIIGGFMEIREKEAEARVWEYNSASNSVKELRRMNDKRAGLVALIEDDFGVTRVYVFGG
jgi:hypothetical protein